MPTKDTLIKRFDFKNVKVIGEAASADQEEQRCSQTPLKTSLWRKDIYMNRFLM